MTDDGIVAIADSCFYLVDLNLRGCSEVTDRAITAFTSHSLRWRRIEKVCVPVTCSTGNTVPCCCASSQACGASAQREDQSTCSCCVHNVFAWASAGTGRSVSSHRCGHRIRRCSLYDHLASVPARPEPRWRRCHSRAGDLLPTARGSGVLTERAGVVCSRLVCQGWGSGTDRPRRHDAKTEVVTRRGVASDHRRGHHSNCQGVSR